MQEDNSGNGPNGLGRENLESPRGKSKGNISSSNNSNKEQDRFLPIANVGRIMKKVITGNGKISKDAKETVQECVSEFISFVTGEASDKCQREKRKTINGDDIIWAITTLGFEDYVAPLKLYLSKYREIEEEKLNIPKQQRQQRSDHQQRSQVVLQHHQPDHHQEQIMPPYTASHHVYSSTGFMSHQQPSFVSADQAFALSFTPSSIQKQFPQQDQIDSVSHW